MILAKCVYFSDNIDSIYLDDTPNGSISILKHIVHYYVSDKKSFDSRYKFCVVYTGFRDYEYYRYYNMSGRSDLFFIFKDGVVEDSHELENRLSWQSTILEKKNYVG